jgi:hypothetical protein
MTTPRTTSDRSAEALPTSWQRLLALSGIAFAVLLVVGFFLSGGDTPDYTAALGQVSTITWHRSVKDLLAHHSSHDHCPVRGMVARPHLTAGQEIGRSLVLGLSRLADLAVRARVRCPCEGYKKVRK